MPGPIPNHSSNLSRERDANRGNRIDLAKGESRNSKPYNAPRDWHKSARQIWDSAAESGQCDFYQQSDWAVLYSLCEDFDTYKRAGRPSAQMATVLYQQLGNLLMTEGDRRRVHVELHDPEAETESAAVIAIADYERELSG